MTNISIHAPVKGATHQLDFLFQPRFISIHAPVKGATIHNPGFRQTSNYFNPRTREGCDGCFHSRLISRTVFQSTHP